MIPLSFGQRRLWFLSKFEEGHSSYNIAFGVRVRGRLDLQVLHSTFVDVLIRHEVLRTVILEEGGVPRQRIIKPGMVHFEMPVTDVNEEEVTRIMAEAARHRFDLSTDLPFLAQVLSISPDDHILVVVVHHIAADGWSLAPLAEDISVAYEAHLQGRTRIGSPSPSSTPTTLCGNSSCSATRMIRPAA